MFTPPPSPPTFHSLLHLPNVVSLFFFPSRPLSDAQTFLDVSPSTGMWSPCQGNTEKTDSPALSR